MGVSSWGLSNWIVYVVLAAVPAVIAFFRDHRFFKGILVGTFFCWIPFAWLFFLLWSIFGSKRES
jgi:hypothetical protein